MQKTIVIGLLIIFVGIIAGVFLVNFLKENPVPITETPKGDEFTLAEDELDAFSKDLEAFDLEANIFNELDFALGDISGEQTVSAESAFDESGIENEASSADISGDLDEFGRESSVLDEVAVGINDISQ